MANLTYPLMRSLPQVVFTAAFLKYPTPAVVCSRIVSAALELCSSVLPSNLEKRELDFSIALTLYFLRKQLNTEVREQCLTMTTKREHSRTAGEQNYVAGIVENMCTTLVIFFSRRITALKILGVFTRGESAKLNEIG